MAAFGIRARSLTHAPVGFGDHHWRVDGRWFATVSDLAHKPHCGDGPVAALRGLRAAMDAAAALGGELDFVVPPVRTPAGDTAVPLDERYALTVFPLVDGEPGEFGQVLGRADHDRVLEMLAELHATDVPAPAVAPDVPGRAALVDLLDRLREPWSGGPFATPARELLSTRRGVVRARLAEFDRLAARLPARTAVTHGEPHPGNLVRGAAGWRLVDWDTVGTAVPERDLAVVSGPLDRYAEVTGYEPDPGALALYRLRWSLVDVAEFAVWLHGPHEASEDSAAALRGLAETLDHLAG
ncbi:phosphotransferase [Saccharothrix sp. SC076]|nr:phosphotransferase [Saccharothrix obliqua]